MKHEILLLQVFTIQYVCLLVCLPGAAPVSVRINSEIIAETICLQACFNYVTVISGKEHLALRFIRKIQTAPHFEKETKSKASHRVKQFSSSCTAQEKVMNRKYKCGFYWILYYCTSHRSSKSKLGLYNNYYNNCYFIHFTHTVHT